jgi:hypothetical protein
MSLGLAFSDGRTIYLATESAGLDNARLSSKILDLQRGPDFALLATGGLDHWYHVLTSYSKQPTLQAACDEIIRLLNECMSRRNQAYGLLCGFVEAKPTCYRINRPLYTNAATYSNSDILNIVQAIGLSYHARAARLHAQNALKSGKDPALALQEAIESRIPGQGLQAPIVNMTL